MRLLVLIAGWMLLTFNAVVLAQTTAEPPVGDKPPVESTTDTPKPEKVELSQIKDWIKQLASSKFAEREAASRSLKQAGLASIPELVKAAQGSNPEVTARAIECLSFLYEAPDAQVYLAADHALELLLQGPPAAAQRTEQAFATSLAPARRRNTISAIQSLGGILIPMTRMDDDLKQNQEANLDEPGSIQHAILGKNWRGDVASTKYLDRLYPELRTVYVTSDAPLKPGDLDQYRIALPNMKVEQRGGYLGISSREFDTERCIVNMVAFDSPAQHAGLKADDRLTHLNGIPVNSFSSLTGQLLFCKSGETVLLDVVRETRDLQTGESIAEELEISVTLGEWGARIKAPEKP